MTTVDLLALAPARVVIKLRRWYFTQLEKHYLICAEVEKRRADEALANVKHYQSRAALARSDRI